MRIAELSERAGVPVPTIKYYLREGLLPPGERTGPNQARYDERHQQRLRLVRVLTEVGGLSIATVREVFAHVDGSGPTTYEVLGRTMRSLSRTVGDVTPADGGHREAAVAVVDELIERRGWPIRADYPARESLIEVVAAIREARHGVMLDELDRYAEAAETLARIDLDVLDKLSDLDTILETAIVGNPVGDTLIATLRRLAQANETAKRHRGG